MNGVENREYRFGEFTLDEARRSISRNGEALTLHPKAFDLLVELIRLSGTVVSKDELLTRVWPDQFVEENNLSVQISALRKLLGEGNGGEYITTVRGRGYAFVAPVENNGDIIVESRTIETITFEPENEPLIRRQLASPSHNYWSRLALVGVLLAAAAFTGAFVWRQFSLPNAFSPSSFSERKLTTSGRVNIAAISPDGKMFAYSLRDVKREHSSIRVGQTNGSSDVEIVPVGAQQNELVSFSMDGQFVYYVEHAPSQAENGTLLKVSALGGVPQKVLSGINIYPAISPDEKRLAVIRTDGKNKTSTLALANLHGSGEQALVTRPLDTPIRALSLAWSKDGSTIAFGSRKENEDANEVFVSDSATGTVRQLTNSKIEKIFRLGWLADGTGLIAITSSVNRAWGKMWHVSYPDGALSEITRDHQQYASALSLSDDARSLLSVEVNAESNIWTSPADRLPDLTQTTFGSLGRQDGWFGLDISQDGRILYTAKNGLFAALWLVNAEGGDPKQLTPADALDFNPVFSPDGEVVAFDSDRSGTSEIWRVRLDGSDLTQLTRDGNNTNPSFLADGQTVVYRHGDANDASLRRISMNGGDAEVVSASGCWSPRASPNGDFVACGRKVGGQNVLAIVSASTGEQLKHFPVPQTYNFDLGGIRWTPDGRFVCYRDWTYGIWRQSIDGGEPQRIEGLPEEKFYQYVWSRDGKRFVLTRGREMRDVVLLSRS